MRVSRDSLTAVPFGIATLALGLTAAGLAYGVLSSVLFRPFALRDPERLVLIWETHRDRPTVLEMTSFSNFVDYGSSSQVFESTAAWQRPSSMTLKNADGAEEIRASIVTAGFFGVLGVEPALGRTFGVEESQSGRSLTVVLSHGFWRKRFGASPEALGSTLVLDGAPHAVIGIAPRDFESPAGESDLFVPMDFTPNAIDRGQNYLTAMGRLKPGISLEQAQREMERLGAALAREFPASNEGVTPQVVRFSDHVLGPVRPVLLAVSGGVLFLLAVACANVSNLQLARIVSREREIAIRLSLGASRPRVFVSTLLESIGIWSGGAAGALLAILFAFPLLSALVGERLPRALEATAGSGTLVFTALMAAGTALAFGIPVALYACRAPLERALRSARAPLTEDPAGRGLRHALVVAQIALACVLLIGGGLLMRSLLHLNRVSLGFEAANVVMVRVALGDGYAEVGRRIRYVEDLLERFRGLPSVISAGASTVSPMNPFGIDFDVPYHRPEEPEPERATAPKARFRSATPGYFQTLATPILFGRDITSDDRADTPRVVVVNRTLGRRLGAEENVESVVGTRLRFFWSDWQTYEIVGVVEDTRAYRAAEASQPELFVPYSQNPYLVMNVAVRSSARPEDFVETARSVVSSLDPDEPAIGVLPLGELVSRTTARENLAARLLGALSAGAILLSLAGVHAVLSFTTRRRVREIGIRMALGAAPRGILTWALRQGAGLTLCGIAAGVLGSAFATRFLADLLFDVSARDPLVFMLAPLLLFFLSMAAS
ncbi:MAG TPA: ABC transporter permease, partial [Vicinamibacteria bacterium]|nr:ABC transporter permease [Vicinamibacteria bacterium]